MEVSLLGNLRMGKGMVKEQKLLEKGNGKEIIMLGNTKMIIKMVKEHTLSLMDGSLW